MTSDDPLVVFLDDNVLAKPVTRTLMLRCAASGYTVVRFASTPPADRQILADAEAAEATFLVTEDVDDFAVEDLRTASVSALNSDLFLAERTDREVYRRALEVMISGMRNPSRTPAQLHSAIARQHRDCSPSTKTSTTSNRNQPGTASLR